MHQVFDPRTLNYEDVICTFSHRLFDPSDMLTAMLVSTVSLEVWNSGESCALIIAASVPSVRAMLIVMVARIIKWASLMSLRKSASIHAQKQSDLSDDAISDNKRKTHIQSAELRNPRETLYQPLVDSRPQTFDVQCK